MDSFMHAIKSGIVLCRQITFFLSLCVISPFMEVIWSTLAVRIQKHLQQVVYQKTKFIVKLYTCICVNYAR